MFNISAIIPAYNAEKTIINCLNSVVNQTIKISEILVIDDGSMDNTAEIVFNYINTHSSSNIILLRQTNSGPSAARNLGIEKAKGDLIAFLDADDCWIKQKSEIQIKILKENENIILIGSRHPNAKRRIFKRSLSTVNFKRLLWENCFSTSTVIVKKNYLSKNSFDINQKYSEDYGLWLKLALKGKCLLANSIVTIADKPVYGYAGLSAHLWKMEKGELKNYIDLFKNENINIFQLCLISVFSLLKFIKRFIVSFNYSYS